MSRLLRTAFRLPRASFPPASVLSRRVYSSSVVRRSAANAIPPSDNVAPIPSDAAPTASSVASAASIAAAEPSASHEIADASNDPASSQSNQSSPPEAGDQHDEKTQTTSAGTVEYQDDKYTIRRKEGGLVIEEGRKRPIEILDIILRDSCKCSSCVDPHSKQRNFRTSDISSDIISENPTIKHGKLHVTWKNDFRGAPAESAHESTYDLRQLRHPIISPVEMESAGKNRWRAYWDNSRMQHWQHWITYDQFINNDISFAWSMRTLAELGLIFIKDIPDSREMVEKIATRMGPIRDTFYGRTWDVRSVPQATNVAYTNQFLGFHMDLMYMNDPPGYQLLHCLQNSCEGGESLFVDTFRVAYDMKQDDHKNYSRLLHHHIPYHYNHPDHFYTNSWPVFETETFDNSVTEGTNFAKSRLVHVNYSPPFQAPRKVQSPVPRKFREKNEALAKFASLLEDERYMFELKLNPGECVVFENRRVAHARRGFKTSTGERWLAGAYVDEDAMLSGFKTSSNKYPNLWRLKRKGLNSKHVKMLKGVNKPDELP
ncbi:hypothetical protein AnigIFM50267_002935 [Aspergillus niger]|nr:hypothetical protein AnigIFM50267_002935 [Aspergillus niger]